MAAITAFTTSGIFPTSAASDTLSAALQADCGVTQADVDSQDGSEIIFNLCNHMYSVVNSGTATKVRSTSNQNLSGTRLTKSYTFSIDLDLTDIGDLNVQDE